MVARDLDGSLKVLAPEREDSVERRVGMPNKTFIRIMHLMTSRWRRFMVMMHLGGCTGCWIILYDFSSTMVLVERNTSFRVSFMSSAKFIYL
jgi:hypothetical protein